MKNFTKILSLLLALTMLLCFPVAVSAAELEDAPIDESRTGSLTIYKYDLTNAEKDGVWDSSYVSTGVFDQTGVNDVLGGSGAALGNGETGYGYAIKGVEFSYVQVADIVQFSEFENDSRTDSHVEILYAIDKTKGADFLKALNLTDGAQRYTNADTLDSTKYYYQSDVLIDALAAALESNSTVVKNALEAYISANGGAAMPLTDAYGKTKAEKEDFMEIKINREIRDYHESMFMGLSLRQTLCSLLGVGAAVGLYFWLNPILGTEVVSWVCMIGAAPFAALGFVSYHGMPAEKFLWVWFRSEILEPKVICFKPTNLYFEIMKDTIAKHEKEARKQHESD